MNPTQRYPRFPLGVRPTPLHRAIRLRDDASILLKRDDLTGFGLAGNKARPLEFLMADALARGCDVVVTGGASSSNFIGACAHAAFIAGVGCEVLVAGELASSMPLQLAQACGASVRLAECDRSAVDEVIERRASEFESKGRHPYAVPRGGATAIGALGFADAAIEVRGQLGDLDIDPNLATIVLPVGSGASLAGFMAGTAAMGLDWRVVGVSVSRPPAQMEAQVMNLSNDCSALMETSPASSGAFTLVDRTGVDIAHDGNRRGARLMRESEGILLDSHYGIPAFEVAMELHATDREPVVLWQTGGLPAAIESLNVSVSDSLVMGRS